MTASAKQSGRASVWAGITLAGIATVAGLRLSDAIGSSTGFVLLALCFVPAALYVRAMGASRRTGSGASSAVYRYNRGMMASGLAYVLGLGIATLVFDRLAPGPSITFALALLPVVPIFAMIATMGRYLVEEKDEYLRHQAVLASLVGLGALLGLASFWGFLEEFGLVPHASGWWSVPVWAIGMGLSKCWMAWRNRAGAEA